MDATPSPSPASISPPVPVLSPMPTQMMPTVAVNAPVAAPASVNTPGLLSNNTPVSPSMISFNTPVTAQSSNQTSVGKALASSFNISNGALVAAALVTGVTLGFSAYTLAEVNNSYEDNRSLSGNTLTAVRWVQGLTIAASALTFAGSVSLLVLKLKYRV